MNESKFSEAFKVIKTIHWTITLMPVLFSIVVLYMNYIGNASESPELTDTFLYISVILLIVAIPMSSVIFKIYLKNNKPKKLNSVKELFASYQTAHLLRLSILEIAGFFAVISAFMTGYLPILGVIVVTTVVMVSLTPSEYKISETFGINLNELDSGE